MKNVIINFVALKGGGCLYSYEITKAICQNGYNVFAIVSNKMDNLSEWKKIPNLHLIIINGYSNKINFITNLLWFLLIGFKRIKKAIKGIDIDLIYIPMISYWTEIIQKYITAKRTVYTAHDVIPHDGKRSFISRSQERIARKSDDIIVLSNSYVETAANLFRKNKKNIYVLPHGNCFNMASNKHQSEMYPIDTFNFIYYGQISEYKGLDILAQAFRILFKQFKNVSLTIAGSGDFSRYEESFKSIGCPRIFIINRWINDEEVPELFSGIKQVAVLPYKNATQSGIIPLAMHLKTPVIATKCLGLIEQISDGETGFLAEINDPKDFANKMIYIIENWEEALVVAEKAYAHIESYNWESIVNLYLSSLSNNPHSFN